MTFVTRIRPPSAKMPATATFVFFGSCKVKKRRIRSSSIARSIRVSILPILGNTALILMHFPYLAGFQNDAMGWQLNRFDISVAISQAVAEPVIVIEACGSFL
jgi:hypothetical protein